jgi:hypothetical protein
VLLQFLRAFSLRKSGYTHKQLWHVVISVNYLNGILNLQVWLYKCCISPLKTTPPLYSWRLTRRKRRGPPWRGTNLGASCRPGLPDLGLLWWASQLTIEVNGPFLSIFYWQKNKTPGGWLLIFQLKVSSLMIVPSKFHAPGLGFSSLSVISSSVIWFPKLGLAKFYIIGK